MKETDPETLEESESDSGESDVEMARGPGYVF